MTNLTLFSHFRAAISQYVLSLSYKIRNNFKTTTSSLGFRSHKSHSPEEVWAAGGTTAFGNKNGQSNENMSEIFKEVPEIEPFTEEEWNSTLKSLKESK